MAGSPTHMSAAARQCAKEESNAYSHKTETRAGTIPWQCKRAANKLSATRNKYRQQPVYTFDKYNSIIL